MNLIYRIAEDQDFKSLQELIDTYLRKDYFLPEAKLRTILSRNCAYVCLDDNVVIGFCYVDSGRRLFNLFVHPDYRGIGIGKSLVKMSNPLSVRCKVNMSTGDPTKFYRDLGYGIMGERIPGKCTERGAKNKKTKNKSILIMLKGHTVKPITDYHND